MITWGTVVAMFALPRVAGWEAEVVRSPGAAAGLREGAVALIEPRQPEEVAVGDVIRYRTRDEVATARVVGITDRGEGRAFLTEGGAGGEAVTAEELEGTVVFSVPYLGYVIDRALTRWGFALLIGVPAALIVAYEVSNLMRARRRSAAQAPVAAPSAGPITEEATPAPTTAPSTEPTPAPTAPSAEPTSAPVALAAPAPTPLFEARPEPERLPSPAPAYLLAAPTEAEVASEHAAPAWERGTPSWERADLWPTLPTLPQPPAPLRVSVAARRS